jgi:hypothetical protein
VGSRRRGLLLGGVLVLGVAALGMATAGVQSPVRSAVVLVFVVFAPAIAIGGLLRGFEPLARAVLAVTAGLVLLTLLATVMVAGGFWSPTGGLWIVAGLTAVGLAAQWPPIARHTGLFGRSTGTQPNE